jgi:hypothetical protein
VDQDRSDRAKVTDYLAKLEAGEKDTNRLTVWGLTMRELDGSNDPVVGFIGL